MTQPRPDTLTPDQRDDYEERAAILQYDAGYKRGTAELLAWKEVMKNV